LHSVFDARAKTFAICLFAAPVDHSQFTMHSMQLLLSHTVNRSSLCLWP